VKHYVSEPAVCLARRGVCKIGPLRSAAHSGYHVAARGAAARRIDTITLFRHDPTARKMIAKCFTPDGGPDV